MCHARFEDKTVIVLYRSRYPLVDATRRGLPQHAPAVSVKFEAILELFGLFACSYQLYHCEELLVSLVFFLKVCSVKLMIEIEMIHIILNIPNFQTSKDDSLLLS